MKEKGFASVFALKGFIKNHPKSSIILQYKNRLEVFGQNSNHDRICKISFSLSNPPFLDVAKTTGSKTPIFFSSSLSLWISWSRVSSQSLSILSHLVRIKQTCLFMDNRIATRSQMSVTDSKRIQATLISPSLLTISQQSMVRLNLLSKPGTSQMLTPLSLNGSLISEVQRPAATLNFVPNNLLIKELLPVEVLPRKTTRFSGNLVGNQCCQRLRQITFFIWTEFSTTFLGSFFQASRSASLFWSSGEGQYLIQAGLLSFYIIFSFSIVWQWCV